MNRKAGQFELYFVCDEALSLLKTLHVPYFDLLYAQLSIDSLVEKSEFTVSVKSVQ